MDIRNQGWCPGFFVLDKADFLTKTRKKTINHTEKLKISFL